MDRIRYGLGVLAFVAYAPGLLFWLVIHPWARSWRALGPARTYLIVFSALAALGALLFQLRQRLLGQDLGTSWSLITFSLVVYGACAWFGLAYGRRVTHLSVPSRMGVPELSTDGPQVLVRDGFYRVVRHPVYLNAAVWGIAYALIVNYVGAYVLFVAAIPVLYVITVLEERELIDRFGEEYREYRREVPRFIPRWRKATG
jgi:protein-S-isoprenylcysteine O-methyltransferase Ste14